MKKLALGALFVGLLVATGCGGDDKPHITLDAGSGAGTCDPLKQTGCAANEKCTWLVDAISPNYVGHVGCAPVEASAAQVGEACHYGGQGTMGYDNCAKGSVCGNYRGGYCPPTGARACVKSADCNPGEACVDSLCSERCMVDTDCDNGGACMNNVDICKPLCDQLEQAGNALCDTNHVCVIYSGLFATGDTTPAAAGVCDLKCDPLADNDFDGSGAMAKTGNTCGSNQGCYGYPSYGTLPRTGWSCTRDININTAQPTGLRHRVQCTEANKCADPGPKIYTNSCNQGYIPLLYETTTVTTEICVAICKPLPCYLDPNDPLAGCGTLDGNRKGQSPDKCANTDRVAADGVSMTHNTTDAHPNDEQCQYLWRREIDSKTGEYLPSDTKDTVGFCFDHSLYQYDADDDGVVETPLPACGAVGLHSSGSDATDPYTYFGADSLGCVTSDQAGVNMVNGKAVVPPGMLERMRKVDMPRALYHREASNAL